MLNPRWKVMGILNATPDSFFDGGSYGLHIDKTVDRASKMVDDGAVILDVGGESTRPGSDPVTLAEELERVAPVIEALSQRFDVTLSVDTTKSEVARQALELGAHWINDISAGRFDSNIAPLVGEKSAVVVLMHSRNNPKTMQDNPHYSRVVDEVLDELLVSVDKFVDAGVVRENIVLDPGIGFAKSVNDNLTLLRSCSRFIETGHPLLIGTSRKSLIGHVTGSEVEQRLAGSLATVGETYSQGAQIFRVHDVRETVDFLKMVDAVKAGV